MEYTFVNVLLTVCQTILNSFCVNMSIGLMQCKYIKFKKLNKTITIFDVTIIKSSCGENI